LTAWFDIFFRSQSFAIGEAEIHLRLRITLFSRFTIPFDGRGRIGLPGPSLRQGHTITPLRFGELLVRGLVQPFSGFGKILGDAASLLVEQGQI
jgi:hypothetical protein